MNDLNVGAKQFSPRLNGLNVWNGSAATILQGRKIRVHYCDCGNDIELVSGWANTCGICDARYDGNGRRSALGDVQNVQAVQPPFDKLRTTFKTSESGNGLSVGAQPRLNVESAAND